MQKRFRSTKRALTKRVTSFNFYVDQATQIQAIMEATGTTMEAPLVRQLVDEALAARRRKLVPLEAPTQTPPPQEQSEILETIQTLLLRIIGQGETEYRIGSISLELLQEALSEAHATRVCLWEHLVAPRLKETGKSPQEIHELFNARTKQAQDHAYGLALEIKNQLLAAEGTSVATIASVDDDDRQGRLLCEVTDTSDQGPQAA
ncbi:MAG: hypothetical protein M3Y84_12195 [Acidobacteriota bacterium]|nr:hypothetical protein [Acidobacteriota bacterium]